MLVKWKMLHLDPCGLKGGTRASEQEVQDRDKVWLILRMRSVIVRAPWPGVSCLERKEFPVAGSDGAEGEPLLVGKLQRGSGICLGDGLHVLKGALILLEVTLLTGIRAEIHTWGA